MSVVKTGRYDWNPQSAYHVDKFHQLNALCSRCIFFRKLIVEQSALGEIKLLVRNQIHLRSKQSRGKREKRYWEEMKIFLIEQLSISGPGLPPAHSG